MAMTRREALTALGWAGGLAGAGAMLPAILSSSARAAIAAPAGGRLYPEMDLSLFDKPVPRGPSEIQIGCAAITWEGKEALAIDQISALDYDGIQLRANVLEEYPDPRALEALLQEHKLTFVALSSGEAPLEPAKRDGTLALHEKHAKYLHAAGGKYLQVIGAGNFTGKQKWTAEDYKRQGALLTEIGKRAAEFGVQTGFHNHMGTVSQTPAATDAIMDAVDPNYVKLELDVAHYQQGGGNPAEAIRKYGRRLLFLHLKDVKPSASARGGYEFVELGQGTVDFPAIFAALRETHFRGWGVVELDGERPDDKHSPKESAQMSKEYLEKKIGVQV